MSNIPNDHYTLTKWMSQRVSFERHKLSLDDVKQNLLKSSQLNLGIMNSYPKLKSVIEDNKSKSLRFSDQMQNIKTFHENKILLTKFDSINIRPNKMDIDGFKHDIKFKVIKDRSNLLRIIRENSLQRENERIGEKIITKESAYSFKKFDEDYQYNTYRKKFARKYELPNIQKKVERIVNVNEFNSGYFPDHKLTVRKILQSNSFNPNPDIKKSVKLKQGIFNRYEQIPTESSEL